MTTNKKDSRNDQRRAAGGAAGGDGCSADVSVAACRRLGLYPAVITAAWVAGPPARAEIKTFPLTVQAVSHNEAIGIAALACERIRALVGDDLPHAAWSSAVAPKPDVFVSDPASIVLAH